MRDPILRDNIYVEENMKLPAGKTCGDCSSFGRCAALFGQVAKDEVCDFSPSRFCVAVRPLPIAVAATTISKGD